MIPGDAFFFVVVVLGLASAITKRAGWSPFEPRRRIARALARLPVTPLADAQPGRMIRIAGRVRLVEPPLRAPLSRRRCAFYELRERTVDENEGAGRERVSERRACEFLVEEGGRHALVRANPAHIAAAFDEAGAGRHHVGVGGRHVRYREAALVEGLAVTIGGIARLEPDPDPPPGAMSGYREVPQRLVFEATPRVPVLVCDVEEDG